MRGPCLALLALSAAHGYDNGSPNSRLPVLGWSSWVALGPGAEHPVFDYCDATNVKNAIDAFFEVGLWDAGYRHFHLDDCWAGGRNATGYLYAETVRTRVSSRLSHAFPLAGFRTPSLMACGLGGELAAWICMSMHAYA